MSVCDVDPTINIVLSWPGSGGDFIIGPECDDSGWWWSSLEYPAFDYRYTTAPPSSWMGGDVLLAAVPAASTLPIGLAIHETSLVALEVARLQLNTAFKQLDLTIALMVDGTPVGIYPAFPALIQWGPITPGLFGLNAAQGSVVVPVNPEVF